MKFSTSLIAVLAPMALAKSVHNQAAKLKRGRDAAILAGMSGFGLSRNALTEVIVVWVNPGAGAATTTINKQVTVTQTVTAGAGAGATINPGLQPSTTLGAGTGTGATASAVGGSATHEVKVGGPGGLVFAPDTINAAVGDMVVFTFLSKNHSATQSAFTTPCDPLAGGMDSGFLPNPNNSVSPAPQLAMQVMVDTPLWFYCAQNGHCGKGMTFSINPSTDKTQAMFQAMAIQQRGTGNPSAITGGQAAPPPPPAAGNSTQTTGAVATATSNIVQGTGTVQPDGSCACAVVVGAGAFPAVGSQGVGNFGGMAGSLPANMAEIV